MHLSSANAKQWSRLNISQKMLEHDEKMYFKNIVSNAINEDLKNMFARLYDIFCFWVFINSILFVSYSIILYHSYLNKRKKYFENIVHRSSCLG